MSFSSLTKKFYRELKKMSNEIGLLVLSRKKGVNAYTDEQLKKLMPIYDDLFADGQKATVEQIKGDITKLVGKYDVPLKYNKDLLIKMNSESVFGGYYDRKYSDLFTKREIYNLKSTILKAKYSGASEKELKVLIQNTINITENRAQQLARYETQRLRSITLDEYYSIPKMKKKYDKVFVAHHDDRVRPTHLAYDGKVADKDGYWDGPLGKRKELPLVGEYNCRCRAKLVKKGKT